MIKNEFECRMDSGMWKRIRTTIKIELIIIMTNELGINLRIKLKVELRMDVRRKLQSHKECT